MRRLPLRFRTILGLVGLGLLGAHVAVGHGSYGLQSGLWLEGDRVQTQSRSPAPTAPLVRTYERRDEEARARRYLTFEPRRIDSRWRELRAAAEEGDPAAIAEEGSRDDAREWARVTASSLNMRAEARVGGERITSFPGGTTLIVLDRSGNWTQVEHPDTGQVGWMSSRFLETTSRSVEAVTNAEADPGA